MLQRQINLFANDLSAEVEIPGLSCITDYISADEEAELLSLIDKQIWLTDLKRRVQHYGYKYDYKARTVSNDAHLGPLPSWLAPVSEKLRADKVFEVVPDQVIVNEYM